MIQFERCLESSEGTVKKYVYSDETALVESVIYRYPDYETRTVLCVSVQSGCPVGCTFCGTGHHFFRNLRSDEICYQVIETLKREKVPVHKVQKFQIMFMSMGEPSLNWQEVKSALITLNLAYPKAQLLISTVGINNQTFLDEFVSMSKSEYMNNSLGLQFSIHHFNDECRDKLIPYKNKMTLNEIRDYGIRWHNETGKMPYCNYIVTDRNNVGYQQLFNIFPPDVFCFTFSVLCNTGQSMSSAYQANMNQIKSIHDDFLSRGYNVRIFDPAGQDDIGGGCGQLWYFQDRVKEAEGR